GRKNVPRDFRILRILGGRPDQRFLRALPGARSGGREQNSYLPAYLRSAFLEGAQFRFRQWLHSPTWLLVAPLYGERSSLQAETAWPRRHRHNELPFGSDPESQE